MESQQPAFALAALPVGGSVTLLLACCLVQWAALDASWASLLLACVVGIGGPLAEHVCRDRMPDSV